jgi:hypothetical protein
VLSTTENKIYLVPELCTMSGLADMLEDLSIRKKIVDHKPPHERKEKTDAMAREL